MSEEEKKRSVFTDTNVDRMVTLLREYFKQLRPISFDIATDLSTAAAMLEQYRERFANGVEDRSQLVDEVIAKNDELTRTVAELVEANTELKGKILRREVRAESPQLSVVRDESVPAKLGTFSSRISKLEGEIADLKAEVALLAKGRERFT